MTGHSRRKQEEAARAQEVWRRRVQGATQEQIAAAVGVTQQAVSKILKKLGDRHAREFAQEALSTKALQTAQLEEVFREALEQWRRSCEDAERVTITAGRTKVFDNGSAVALPDLVTTVTEAQSGNPSLLAQAMKALADVRAIWGLDSPARTELSGPGQGPVRITEVRVETLTAEIQGKLTALAAASSDPESGS